MDLLQSLENLAPKNTSALRKIEYKNLPLLPVNFDKFQNSAYGRTMVAATMQFSEYVGLVVISKQE